MNSTKPESCASPHRTEAGAPSLTRWEARCSAGRRAILTRVNSQPPEVGIIVPDSRSSEPGFFEDRQESLLEFLKQARRRLDVPPAVERDLPQASGPVVGPDGEAVHAVLFRALDPESLAREVQVPFPGGSEEADHVEKVGVRFQRVAIADEVLRHRDAESGAAQHEEGAV